MNEFQGNPNPQAKVGFVIYYPFQYFVYKNIYRHLEKEAEFIVDMGIYFPQRQPEGLLEDICRLLDKEKVRYRILPPDAYYFRAELDNFFVPYEALVSVWGRGCMAHACSAGKRKVTLQYGSGKDLTTYSLMKREFDLILAYGPRYYDLYSLMTQCEIVGNPKFDDWFNEAISEVSISELKVRIDPEKRTVLYLPTHSDLSALDELSNELNHLSDNYNVLVKLHYFNAREEEERVRKLDPNRVVIYDDSSDLLALLRLADIVLSDNSSAIFDAVLADKPVLVTDFLSEEFIGSEHRAVKQKRRGLVGFVTYTGSIEQKIKKEGLVATIQKPEDLGRSIEDILREEPSRFPEAREKMRRELFSYRDGTAGKRAAEAIEKLRRAPRLPQRPILYHLVEAFAQKKSIRTKFQSDAMAKKLESFQSALLPEVEQQRLRERKEKIWSVFIFDTRGSEGQLELTLRSLLNQNTDPALWEIIVLSSSPRFAEDIVAAFQKKSKQTLSEIRVLDIRAHQSWGEALRDAIQAIRGEICCFTYAGCIVQRDWLSYFFFIYQKYPMAMGAGGYIRKEINCETDYDEFVYTRLLKKMGMERKDLMDLYELNNGILSQNPAGSLANMSYRRAILSENQTPWKILKSPEMLEMALKIEALKVGSLCFIPFSVKDIFLWNRKSFDRQCWNYGRALYHFVKRRFPESIFSFWRAPEYRGKRLRLVTVFLRGQLLEMMGFYYEKLLNMSRTFENKSRR